MKILYIAGRGHSGSTILDLLLGNSFEIESVGEFSSIRKREASLLCASCGSECDVLEEVLYKLNMTSDQLIRKLRFLESKRRLFVGLEEYQHIMSVIYDSYDLKGKNVVLDSSKDFFKALKLKLCGLDVHFLLINRSFGSTLQSYSKRFNERGTWNIFGKKRQTGYFPGMALVTVGYIYGLLMTLILLFFKNSLVINYEKLSNPDYYERILNKLIAKLALKRGSCNIYDDVLIVRHRQRGNKVLRQTNIRYEKR
jgi:hypothetical protein